MFIHTRNNVHVYLCKCICASTKAHFGTNKDTLVLTARDENEQDKMNRVPDGHQLGVQFRAVPIPPEGFFPFFFSSFVLNFFDLSSFELPCTNSLLGLEHRTSMQLLILFVRSCWAQDSGERFVNMICQYHFGQHCLRMTLIQLVIV